MQAEAEEQQPDRAWVVFIQALDNKETFKGYSSDLRQYMRFFRMDKSDMLLQGTSMAMEDMAISFIRAKKSQGTSAPRIRRIVAAVKLFYEVNRVALNWKFVTRHIGRTKAKKDGAYSHDQIRKALAVASLRDRVMTIGLCSSGIRRAGLAELDMKHLEPVDKYGIFHITVYEGEDEEYATYCTPEWKKTLQEYLEYRRRSGEKIRPDSPVLRDEFNREDIDRARFPKRLTPDTISQIMIDLMERAGVRTRKQMTEGMQACQVRHPVKAVHGLRKFWDTQMTLSGVSPLWIELLEGHTIKGVKHHYLRPTDQELLEGSEKLPGYVAAIDRLTIYDEHRLKQELVDAKKTIEHKDEMLGKFETLQGEFANMLRRYAKQQKQIDELKSRPVNT